MDFIIYFCLCICFVVIFALYIGRFVKKGKSQFAEKDITTQMTEETKTEFETLKFKAEVIDLNCRVEMIGIKKPKTVTVFTVVFEADDKKTININIPKEMYDGLEIGQRGEVTIIEGELYSFVI